MNATGIVAEYNPFHKGHLFHLMETKKAINQPIITVMSGSFMQRGEPAFADKWLRARTAVDCGIDLVLELPTVFSLKSAEHFAKGSIALLQATGVVDYLSCGAENAEINYLDMARFALSDKVQNKIHAFIKQGRPYAKACELALGEEAALASKPNNILALEYAKALLTTNIHQLVIARNGAGYNDTALTEFASATAVRKAYYSELDWKSLLPLQVVKAFEQNTTAIGCNYNKLWQLLNYQLRISTPNDVLSVTECKEGMEKLLLDTVKAESFEAAVSMCTTKRYSASRIRRLFMQLLLNTSNLTYKQQKPAYIRVLAFNDTGRCLLSKMKKTSTLPIITKLGRNPIGSKDDSFSKQLSLDIRASNIVALLRPCPQNYNSDYLTSPYYKR